MTATPWYDDLCSCLQVDLAFVLQNHGWDPLQALGAGWSFSVTTGAWEPVEYFHPASHSWLNGDFARALAPHHPLRVTWHQPTDASAAHRDLVEQFAVSGLPIVAVDNYHLPFRPAYHDVHSGHLVLVRDYDGTTDAYEILDPMPPAFCGWLPRQVLENSRASANEDDGSNPFFAGVSPAWRWLEVRPSGEQPALSWDWLVEVLTVNLAGLRGHAEDVEGPSVGLPALAGLIDGLPDRVRLDGDNALRELYVIGWPAQAEAAIHGQFLAAAARRLDRPRLAEAGRAVELVAHGWTGVRIAAGHGARGQAGAVDRVLRLGRTLLRRWDEALAWIETAQSRDR